MAKQRKYTAYQFTLTGYHPDTWENEVFVVVSMSDSPKTNNRRITTLYRGSGQHRALPDSRCVNPCIQERN